MMLYVVRHAWAGHYGDPAWPDDRLRPLTEEGRARFAEVVDRLRAAGVGPQVVATSPLLRCRQTAELLAAGVASSPPVHDLPALVPGSSLRAALDWTQHVAPDADEVAWVGHNPDVGHLAAALIGPSGARFHFAKGAVAAIRFPGVPEEGRGELRWFATAKLLGC